MNDFTTKLQELAETLSELSEYRGTAPTFQATEHFTEMFSQAVFNGFNDGSDATVRSCLTTWLATVTMTDWEQAEAFSTLAAEAFWAAAE